MLKNGSVIWRLTCFYGFPERTRRREYWDLIKNLASVSTLPWCIVGDFNDMISVDNKKGQHRHPQHLLDGFKRCIDECGLTELELTGGKYTWEKSRGSRDWVRERIDHAFGLVDWLQMFPLCNLKVHHSDYSDHDPIEI